MNILGILLLSLALANGARVRRIVGGSEADLNKYPYQVALKTNDPDNHFCSGSILNENWILTTAHCFHGKYASNIRIVAGTNHLDRELDTYNISAVVTHPKNSGLSNYDIALLRIEGRIRFNERVASIELPSKDLAAYNVSTYFAGWGRKTPDGTLSNALHELKVNIITNERCRRHRPSITKDHICTKNDYGQGMCYGDSGGPLVVDGVQVGIASYGRPCGLGIPDVFTKVLSYVDWIVDTQAKYSM